MHLTLERYEAPGTREVWWGDVGMGSRDILLEGRGRGVGGMG